MLTSPVISTTCTRIPAMRVPDPRVQALPGARRALALRPAGLTSRDLRHYLAPQPGKTPANMTGGQISYHLRRLRARQITERIPHSRTHQVTEDGLALALFFTRLTRRVLIPGLAQLTGPGPPPAPGCARQTAPTSQPSPSPPSRHPSPPDHPRSPLSAPRRPSRHTRRNLTRNSRSLRGKITYRSFGRS
jgi:hypothetical protein